MEHSSPLAAMQPSSLPIGQWGCRNETQDTFPYLGRQCGGQHSFGPSSFNFKDLSMKKSPTDYFNSKPVRGSSPTASLAADLSQNFHIDRRQAQALKHLSITKPLTIRSPRFPTPRRALFSTNLFGTLSGRGRFCIIVNCRGWGSQNFRMRHHATAPFLFSGSRQRFFNGTLSVAPQSTISEHQPNPTAIPEPRGYTQ